MTSNLYANLEYAIEQVCKEMKSTEAIIDWCNASENDLWNELVSCILGSQVQHEHAQAATKHLVSKEMISIDLLRDDNEKFEKNIQRELNQPIFPPFTEFGGRKYRYPKIKANYIRRTGETIYSNRNSIKKILNTAGDERSARKEIIAYSIGIGPKQASLFLRNVGYAENLAILDTHILRYMSLIGLVPHLLKTVSYLNAYEQIEIILQEHAQDFKEKLSYLDTAIWIVMRACGKEMI